MSSSFVVGSHQSSSKKDDTLIIVVNDDGTISVDQETLQNLIMNQSDANVSVVRVGQSEGDAENGDLTLTVDPPTFERNENNAPTATATSDVTGLVDPFMEMDPEQLEKLETALQSEQAKQILGENVTAMLDMLTVEEQQKSIKYCIELDHCYTSRTSPADPEPSDPLPIANSPDINDDFELAKHSSQQQISATVQNSETNIIDNPATPVGRSKNLLRNTTTRTVASRGRKVSASVNQATSGLAKTSLAVNPRNTNALLQQSPNRAANIRVESEQKDDDSQSTSSESSESEPPSDDDSDFGPRGPKRGGGRPRGGRKGLTTRGGSTTAARRRSTNKQMDMDQMRRLDMEMAAAVVAMKSPEKPERPERFNPSRAKKKTKSNNSGRKKEDTISSPPSPVSTSTTPETVVSPGNTTEKPLQTTNQVKANLINANMIKGDMILTKPGQARNNQKVLFVQKRVMMRPNEMKTFGIKRQSLVVGKSPNEIAMKVATTSDDGKLVPTSGRTISMSSETQPEMQSNTTSPTTSPILSPSVASSPSIIGLEQQHSSQIEPPASQLPQQLLQHEQLTPEPVRDSTSTTSPPLRNKSTDVKREKKKSECDGKIEDISKSLDPKTPDVAKKHVKKDQRKVPIVLADTLGPALFSTPDIIRRVGSDAKNADTSGMNASQDSCSTINATSGSSDLAASPTLKNSGESTSGLADTQITRDSRTCGDSMSLGDEAMETQGLSRVRNDEIKSDSKIPTAEELEPSLDPATKVASIAENPELVRSTDVPVVPNEIISGQSGIEGEEHLLATLEMEAGKHDEELLAEALLLQEELGVDLADHPALAEPAAVSIPETLLSPSRTYEGATETSLQRSEGSMKFLESVKSPGSSTSVVSALNSPIVSQPAVETPKKRDDKEPIQIIRGGRVITLPPIEAPTTRSKRLQAKPETPQKLQESPRKEEKIPKQIIQQQQKMEETLMERENMSVETNDRSIQEDDDDDDEEEEEENSDSEDDPDRLWCICKRPHNNRFMICCDVCEDWFHGKCVHVSKAMGQQMEEKGIEWVCPNCLKKKDQGSGISEQKKLTSTPGKVSMKVDSSSKATTPRGSSTEKVRKVPTQPTSLETLPPPSPSPTTVPANVAGVTQCVVCKKEARNSSIYCSDACILTHAQETLTRDNKPNATAQTKVVQGTSDAPLKTSMDARVIVFERKSGKVLTGSDAPTRSNLKTWLKENPTFEVVRPNNLNTLQIGGKTVTAIQTQGISKFTKSTPGTSPNIQSKMVYSKVMGSKQTVLAPSNKKLVVLSGGQQRLSPKTIQQQKPQGSTGKSPVMRQTTIKLVSQQGTKSPTGIVSKQSLKKQEAGAKGASGSPQPNQQQQQQQKTAQKTPPAKKSEPEPIRLNVRKTLAELLTTRIRDCKDLSLSDEEINDLALNIELELYKYFRDTGSKYKSKYRSLVFNIKDTKNLTLFRKIADRSLTPDAVVRLSPDEMASQELAEWREKETKHQLEMIKKNELDLMAQAKSIVVKTHKGELIIENQSISDHVDPKTPVQDIVTVLNSQEGEGEESKEDGSKTSHSSEDSRWKPGITTSSGTTTGASTTNPSEDRKKKDRERTREKERGGEGKTSKSSNEKDSGKLTRKNRMEEDEEGRRNRSHSRGRNRRSRDRERSRDRKSMRSKDGKREGMEKESKDRERHKSGKEGRQREKDRERRGRGKNKDHRNRSNRGGGGGGEDEGRGGSKNDKKNDSGQQTGSGDGTEVKPIEDRLWRHVEEESTSTMITIPTTTTTMTTTTTSLLTPDGNDSDVSDREPSSTVNIKTPDINEESERDKNSTPTIVDPSQKQNLGQVGSSQTVWRGFVNMVDVAKFFITAQEVSGQAKDLMEDLPDTVDVVGRISHETVWDYISKMKKTGSKEILVIRLTAANDEEKIPYITLYSYLNSRSRLGVVGNVSKNIKDFYIMPFSRQSQIPSVLLPLVGPGFEDQRPHLLLGIIVRNKRKRMSNVSSPVPGPPAKMTKKDGDDSSIDTSGSNQRHHHHHHHHHHLLQQSPPDSPRPIHKGLLLESLREKQTMVTQMTLETLNKAQVGMSRSAIIDNATISKLVPELSSKIDLCESPTDDTPPSLIASNSPTAGLNAEGIGEDDEPDDGDEPYSPGGATDVEDNDDIDDLRIVKPNVLDITGSVSNLLSPTKNSTELQRKMDELNRQIEEQKQQIQSISSSFLGDSVNTLPGLGLDPPDAGDSDEAYSPTDARSFTPPPPGIAKFAQPLLDKVSDITIPPNLQEILANVKRQESSKIDPYLPSKPSATFLTSSSPSIYPVKSPDKYTPTFINKSIQSQANAESNVAPSTTKETKSTLRSLSDLDLIKKAEEELAAVAAAEAGGTVSGPTLEPEEDDESVPIPPPTFSMPPPPPPPPPPPLPLSQNLLESTFVEAQEITPEVTSYGSPIVEEIEKKSGSSISLEQPKPPGLEDEDLPVVFPTNPPNPESANRTTLKFVPKSGVVLSVKRKVSDDGASSSVTPIKAPRTKSRWGQGPSE